jgi:hypothetical protein
VAASIQYRCIQAVHDEIQGLDLDGLASTHVHNRKLPSAERLDYPAVICSLPPGEGEQMVGGLNASEDVGYPVAVTIIAAENRDWSLDTDGDRCCLWREKIILHFHNKRLPGVSEVYHCKVEPRQTIDTEAFMDRNLLVSVLVVRCIARQARV